MKRLWTKEWLFYASAAVTIGVGGFSVVLSTYPDRPELFVLRDGLVVLAFGLGYLYLLVRLLRQEQKITRLESATVDGQQKLAEYLRRAKDLVVHHRDALFETYLEAPIAEALLNPRDWTPFHKVCLSLTTEVRESFEEYFRHCGVDSRNDVAVSVKLTLSGTTLIHLGGNRLNTDQRRRLTDEPDKKWIVTGYRDPVTFAMKEREVNEKVYDPGRNTAFIRIFSDGRDSFVSSDLSSLGDAYLNENDNWSKYYNSTLVVPIGFIAKDPSKSGVFGALAVDSRNAEGHHLFETDASLYIAQHAAAVLAHLFLVNSCVKFQSQRRDDDQSEAAYPAG